MAESLLPHVLLGTNPEDTPDPLGWMVGGEATDTAVL